VNMWDTVSGVRVWQMTGQGNGFLMQFSSNDASLLVVTVDYQDSLCSNLYSAKTGEILHKFRGCAEFSEDRCLLMHFNHEDQTADIHEGDTGKCLRKLCEEGAALEESYFIDDGLAVLGLTKDGKCLIWSTSTWEQVGTCSGVAEVLHW